MKNMLFSKSEIVVLSVIVAALVAAVSCAFLRDAADKFQDRIPQLVEKAPEIAADIAAKDWVELAKDVADALGIDPSSVNISSIASRAPEISGAASRKDWASVAVEVLRAIRESS